MHCKNIIKNKNCFSEQTSEPQSQKSSDENQLSIANPSLVCGKKGMEAPHHHTRENVQRLTLLQQVSKQKQIYTYQASQY